VSGMEVWGGGHFGPEAQITRALSFLKAASCVPSVKLQLAPLLNVQVKAGIHPCRVCTFTITTAFWL